MFSLSVLSLLANIAPYMTLVGFATGLHRCTFADNGIAVNFLQNFRFLFFRHKPAYFFWSWSARSVLLCMFPVVFTTPAVQVIVMTLVSVFFQVLQVDLQVWRAPLANMIDAQLLTSMVLLATGRSHRRCMIVGGTVGVGDFTKFNYPALAATDKVAFDMAQAATDKTAADKVSADKIVADKGCRRQDGRRQDGRLPGP